MTVDRHRAWLDMLVQSAREMNDYSVLEDYRSGDFQQDASARFASQCRSFVHLLRREAGDDALRAANDWEVKVRSLKRRHPEWSDVLPMIAHEVELELEKQSRDPALVRFVKGNRGCLIITVVLLGQALIWTLVAFGVITFDLSF